MGVRAVSATWADPPAALVLGPEEVHVWRVDVKDASNPASPHRLLSEDERRNAESFLFEEDRERFAATRCALRVLLGRYLDLEPEHLTFRRGPRGKPHLDREHGLRFNVSHSGTLALIALARGREVGVDVERVRPVSDLETIAGRHFSTQEDAALRALPEAARAEAFFTLWTRNEARLKATGDGLPGAGRHSLGAARWTARDLDPGSGYAGAVAAEAGGWRLERWSWSERLFEEWRKNAREILTSPEAGTPASSARPR